MARPRPPGPRSAEHQAVVDRRLELLSAELAGVRGPEEGWPMPETHTRVRPPAGDWPPADDDEVPAPMPDPGRHASARWTRWGMGPPHLAVVAAAVLTALAVAGWWWLSARASEPEPLPSAPPTGLASASPATIAGASPAAGVPPAADASPGGEVTVDVEGKVRRPGIAVLAAGSRVVDALEAAGGARRGVDVSGLNLARVLVDGEQVVVGLPAPSGVPSVAASGLPPAAGALVNLNTASEAELESLPEVGPVTAQSIIGWRDEHGGFTAVDELLEVDGIGDATLEKLLPFVTV